ncbi:hypothetical protein I4F81_003759 [Pyropia yezoensis]|uniref:Uncharacterized protein n=1 Tax=Pyropia yezoensis TaxID=2788 RepID=A0ACC3BTI1_PYRYE|nr:hypothetical protein I4F81_003759 [Neopyropia yezoensis]
MSPSSDSARQPFFTYVDTAAYSARPTFVAFYKLLDNYSAHTGVTEELTPGEQEEIDGFLDAIMCTPIMQYATMHAMARRSQMVTVRFSWHDAVKAASTIFVGTSPEIEMALYSLIYLCGGGREPGRDEATAAAGGEEHASEAVVEEAEEGQPPEETEGSAALNAIGKELFRQALKFI